MWLGIENSSIDKRITDSLATGNDQDHKDENQVGLQRIAANRSGF